jgi:hypothetical protein
MGWFWRRTAVDAEPVNAVYVWPSWKGYYVGDVVPRARQVLANPSDRAEDVLAKLPPTIRRFLFHLDLTETANFPLDRMGLLNALQARSIRVFNAGVTSLGKRTLHTLARRLGLPCAEAPRTGDASELLMVKTDRNYGGRSERILGRRYRRLLGVQSCSPPIRDAFDYRVLPRSKIPAAWWDDPDLVVERFISNREHRMHRVRIALDHYGFWSGVSPLPVKKTFDCTDTIEHFLRRGELSEELPRTLLETTYRFAEGFSMDYGSLDLIGDDTGQYFVIDANSTPGRGSWVPDRMAFLQAAWDGKS